MGEGLIHVPCHQPAHLQAGPLGPSSSSALQATGRRKEGAKGGAPSICCPRHPYARGKSLEQQGECHLHVDVHGKKEPCSQVSPRAALHCILLDSEDAVMEPSSYRRQLQGPGRGGEWSVSQPGSGCPPASLWSPPHARMKFHPCHRLRLSES